MSKIKWIVALSFLISYSLAAKTPQDENSILIANLPPTWRIITRSETKTTLLTEYIPVNEKAGQHSKIIAQVVLEKPKNQKTAFANYHRYKIMLLNNRGCEINPMITDAFRNQKKHYEVFTYECAAKNFSGVDLIYDADKTNIYDLMYEVSTRRLSAEQITEAINRLKDFRICDEGDTDCLNKNQKGA